MGGAPLVPGRLAGPSHAHALPWTGRRAAGVAGRGTERDVKATACDSSVHRRATRAVRAWRSCPRLPQRQCALALPSRPARSTPEERKQPPGPRGRPRERAGGGLWWRRKGRSNRWGRLSPNRNGKQQKRSWRLLLGSASRGWERGGRWRGSWPGLLAGASGALQQPQGPGSRIASGDACVHTGPASCVPSPALPTPLACTHVCADTPIFPHVGRRCVEANPGVKRPVADTPAQHRCPGDADR